jgi:hypothetical protein
MSGDEPKLADAHDAEDQDYAGTPAPDAILPALDEDQLAALAEVGRGWDRVSAEQLPPIETTRAAEEPTTPTGRAGHALSRILFGPPLDVSAVAAERMRKLVALPVLSADALSSVAYGPEAMLAVLVLAGLPGLSYSIPVGATIVVLMLAVGVSYRQTIRAYPQGGGSYIVATENLGRVAGLTAAAGLLIDYVMTVAVSIASGMAAITSAFPSLQPWSTWIGVGVIAVLLAGNR